MTFNDIKFIPYFFGRGFISNTKIGEYTLSVACGEGAYCSPRQNLNSVDEYDSFEIAIWKDDMGTDWLTSKFTGGEDLVEGWCNRDKINEIIQAIENNNGN